MATKAQRLKPNSRKASQQVNKAGDSPSLHAMLYRIRVGIWRELLKNDPTGKPKLIPVPRENRGAYREGMLLVREGYALCECSGENTLWIRRAPHCKEEDVKTVLMLATVKPMNSPAHY